MIRVGIYLTLSILECIFSASLTQFRTLKHKNSTKERIQLPLYDFRLTLHFLIVEIKITSDERRKFESGIQETNMIWRVKISDILCFKVNIG